MHVGGAQQQWRAANGGIPQPPAPCSGPGHLTQPHTCSRQDVQHLLNPHASPHRRCSSACRASRSSTTSTPWGPASLVTSSPLSTSLRAGLRTLLPEPSHAAPAPTPNRPTSSAIAANYRNSRPDMLIERLDRATSIDTVLEVLERLSSAMPAVQQQAASGLLYAAALRALARCIRPPPSKPGAQGGQGSPAPAPVLSRAQKDSLPVGAPCVGGAGSARWGGSRTFGGERNGLYGIHCRGTCVCPATRIRCPIPGPRA